MENVGERVGSIPGFCQVAVQVHLRVAREQSVENQAVEALRLAVSGVTRVEIDGIGLDEEGEGGRIEFLGA